MWPSDRLTSLLGIEHPLMNTLTGPLRKESAARDFEDFVSLWSGQAVGLNREKDARTLMENLVTEAQKIMRY